MSLRRTRVLARWSSCQLDSSWMSNASTHSNSVTKNAASDGKGFNLAQTGGVLFLSRMRGQGHGGRSAGRLPVLAGVTQFTGCRRLDSELGAPSRLDGDFARVTTDEPRNHLSATPTIAANSPLRMTNSAALSFSTRNFGTWLPAGVTLIGHRVDYRRSGRQPSVTVPEFEEAVFAAAAKTLTGRDRLSTSGERIEHGRARSW